MDCLAITAKYVLSAGFSKRRIVSTPTSPSCQAVSDVLCLESKGECAVNTKANVYT